MKKVSIIGDIECGLHSGIKPCCIAWYILAKRPIYALSRNGIFSKFFKDIHDKFFLRIIRKGNRVYFRDGYRVGYIVCPRCQWTEEYIDIKPCPYAMHWNGYHSIEREPIPDDLEEITILVGKKNVPIKMIVMKKEWEPSPTP